MQVIIMDEINFLILKVLQIINGNKSEKNINDASSLDNVARNNKNPEIEERNNDFILFVFFSPRVNINNPADPNRSAGTSDNVLNDKNKVSGKNMRIMVV